MDKLEYLSAVRERLKGLPEEDIKRSLDYYVELIEDRMEDGMSEQEAVAAMPAPDEAAAQILMDQPLVKVVRAKAKPHRKLSGWEIALLVLGFPLWLPLLITAVALICAFYIVLWSVAIALWAVELSLAVSAAACLFGAIALLISSGAGQAVLALGAALVCAGVAILFFFVCLLVSKGIISIGKALILWIKAQFIRREDAA